MHKYNFGIYTLPHPVQTQANWPRRFLLAYPEYSEEVAQIHTLASAAMVPICSLLMYSRIKSMQKSFKVTRTANMIAEVEDMKVASSPCNSPGCLLIINEMWNSSITCLL